MTEMRTHSPSHSCAADRQPLVSGTQPAPAPGGEIEQDVLEPAEAVEIEVALEQGAEPVGVPGRQRRRPILPWLRLLQQRFRSKKGRQNY
jgi:hypothetical protein